ncbi:WAS/WASL-interacting protein family member 3-like [Penaeus monodon]|uniref:WAS/WASL-interacting protein family member 3-like n=1 Tax=Penaeus monodon TaxID=6687 RepID=UPI0018A75A8F|nr:WAS/WASL-interacting protein family member 3-like [Penaeus monodon]
MEIPLIALYILLPTVCLWILLICCYFYKTRKTDSFQNNSSQSENQPFQHTRAAVTSSSGNIKAPPRPPAASGVLNDRNEHHFPSRYVGKKIGRDDGTATYEEPRTQPADSNSPEALVPGNYFFQNEIPTYLAPRIPSREETHLKFPVEVPRTPTPGGLQPQPPTPGRLPPQPPTPGRLPLHPPISGSHSLQPPTLGRLLLQPPTPAWLPSQPLTSRDIPPQPPFTPKLGSETQASPAKKLPLPPPSHVITNGEGTARIIIEFPSEQATPRNLPWPRPVTQAFFEINKHIKIKFKT